MKIITYKFSISPNIIHSIIGSSPWLVLGSKNDDEIIAIFENSFSHLNSKPLILINCNCSYYNVITNLIYSQQCISLSILDRLNNLKVFW